MDRSIENLLDMIDMLYIHRQIYRYTDREVAVPENMVNWKKGGQRKRLIDCKDGKHNNVS